MTYEFSKVTGNKLDTMTVHFTKVGKPEQEQVFEAKDFLAAKYEDVKHIPSRQVARAVGGIIGSDNILSR